MARIKVTNAPTAETPAATPPDDALRKQIADREKEIADKQNAAIARTQASMLQDPSNVPAGASFDAAGFFGAGAKPFSPPTSAPPAPAETPRSPYAEAMQTLIEEGDEISVSGGEEQYGKPGTYSSYTVGPIATKDRVRKGETKADAIRRVLALLRQLYAEERARKHAEFAAQYEVVAGKRL